jgi:hypothetical protein
MVSGGSTAYLRDRLNPVVAGGDFLLSGLELDEIYAHINLSGTTSFLVDALGSTWRYRRDDVLRAIREAGYPVPSVEV